MSRRITITIEQVDLRRGGAVATVNTESVTHGPGALADQIAELANRATAMWSQVDRNSSSPREEAAGAR